MPAPAPTPQEKALKRVLRLAAADSIGVIVVAGASLVVSLFMLEPVGIVVCALVLYGGWQERRGRAALVRRDADTGLRLLVRSQMIILATILVYCARCLGSYDAGFVQDLLFQRFDPLLQAFLGMDLKEFMAQSGLTTAELLTAAHRIFVLLYVTVAFVSILYQGGMALYYRAKSRLVREALAAPPVLPPNPPLA